MCRTRTQIGDDTVPLAAAFGTALTIGHHVHLKLEIQIVGHVLHQVDRVTIATRHVVGDAGVDVAFKVAENARDFLRVVGGHTQTRNARQAPVLVVFVEHFRLHDERRRENGGHAVNLAAVPSRPGQSTTGPQDS